MKTNININAEEWCNLVFEGKNKEYGAFAMRTEAANQQVKGLLIAVSLAATVAVLPLLTKKILPADAAITDSPHVMVSVTLPEKEEVIRPVLDLPKPVARPMIQFLAPVIDNNVTEGNDLVPQDVLINSGAVIGNRNLAGDINSTVTESDLATLMQVTDEDPVVGFVEKMPHYPGLEEYLQKNLRYPELAKEMHITGRVIVQFVVGKTGEIRDVKVVRGIGGGCDEEAERIVKRMPRWNPGIQNDKPVSVIFTLPIMFTLNQ